MIKKKKLLEEKNVEVIAKKELNRIKTNLA